MSKQFKDADKKANDLFKKGFVTGSKYTGCLKTASGVTFTAEAAKEGSSGPYKTKVSAKYSDAKSGFSVNKFEIASHAKGSKGAKPNLVAEVSLDESSLPDFKFLFNVGIAQNLDYDGEKAEMGVDYTVNKNVTANVTVDPVNVNGSFTLLGSQCCYTAGIQANAKSANGTFSADSLAYDVSGFLAYNHGDLSIVNRVTKKTCTLNVFHQYSSALSLGSIASFDHANCNPKNKDADFSKGVSIKVGGKYKIDGNSDLCANLAQNGTLKLGYSQKIYPRVKVSGTATVDLKTSSGALKDPTSSFGFQMDFGDI